MEKELCSIVQIDEALREESQRRISIKDSIKIEYGIKYLDSVLDSVLRGEFVLLTSDSGVGKTQCLYDIAYSNAKNNIKVVLFALESFKNEPIARMKYKHIANKFYKNEMQKKYGKIYYDRWIRGDYQFLYDLEKEATKELREVFGDTLFIYKNNTAFTYDVFEKTIDKIASLVDLIVLDHIHYFEIRTNQYLEEGILARRLKAIAEDLEKPVIAAGHIRKNREKDIIIHDKEDTMGSSDIYKNATTLISMCPATKVEIEVNHSIQFPTFFRVCKSRYSGAGLKNYMGMHIYDLIESKYKEDFNVFKLNYAATKCELLSMEQYPSQLVRDFETIETDIREGLFDVKKSSTEYFHD